MAEQLLRGGIPAVRQAIEEQNTRARADGRPEVTPGPLLAMAEQLLPVINLAIWKDRASVARTAGKDAPFRELRSIVASSSTVTLDDEGTELATALRAALNSGSPPCANAGSNASPPRSTTVGWSTPCAPPSGRPSRRPGSPPSSPSGWPRPPGSPWRPTPPPENWLALLEVVVESPVRRTVKPAGLPVGADDRCSAARKASGYVPELARLMGIPIPPPPGPRRPVPARAGRRAS